MKISLAGGSNKHPLSSGTRVGALYRPYVALARAVVPCIFAGTVVVLSGVSAAHAEATTAESFVRQSVEKGFSILKDTRLAPQERQSRFQDLLRSIIDFRRVAMFALGPYAKSASDQQIDAFVNAFSDYFINMFHLDSDPQFASENIAVTGSTKRATDDALVTASIAGADSGPGAGMDLSFRVRKDANGHDCIVDILVGGISMAVTERDEFSSYLQQHGGNIDQLSAELQRRVAAK